MGRARGYDTSRATASGNPGRFDAVLGARRGSAPAQATQDTKEAQAREDAPSVTAPTEASPATAASSKTDPFTAVFGSQRSSNLNRRRLRIVGEPGLTVLLRHDWHRGSELSFRTQHTDERQAVVSAFKQMKRKHKELDRKDWSVVSVTPEPKVSDIE